MTQFDWRTDEEQGWDQRPQGPAPPADQGPRWRQVLQSLRRRWRSVLSGLLFLAALGTLGARVATLRVEQAEATAREEINATFALLVDAISNQDDELFLTLLGGDRSWRRAQLEIFEHSAFLRRDGMGLTWPSQDDLITEINLSPNLQQALITTTLSYEGYAGGGVSRTFGLQHVLAYERQAAQWRLIPRDEEPDAGWATSASQGSLEAVFPREDAALARRLADDMRAALHTVCNSVAECPADLQVHVRFDLMPGTLHTPSIAINGTQRNRLSLYLPAPSLVGVPATETAYEALRNAYLRTMLDTLFTSLLWRDAGPDSAAFHNALRRHLFVNLDLLPWPPPDVVEAPVAEAVRDADVMALCASNWDQGASLLRYDAVRQSWAPELEGRNLTRLVGLEEIPGVLLQDQVPPFYDPQSRIIWWAEGRERMVFDDYFLADTVPSRPSFIGGAPDGQRFWVYLGDAKNCDGHNCDQVVIRDEPTVWSPDGAHTLFRRALEGSRSPPSFDDMLWLGDRNGEAIQRLDEGYNPLWIDDETFVYLVFPPERDETFPLKYDLVVSRLVDRSARVVARVPLRITEALQAGDGGGVASQEEGIAISHVFVHPARPETVYIVGVRFATLISSSLRQYAVYLFSADMSSGEVTIRMPGVQMQWATLPRLSPDGRFLAYITYNPQNGEGQVAVHDLNADVTQANVYERQFYSSASVPLYGPDFYPSIDWSPGSGDMLVLDQGVLYVIDPQTWTEQTIIPPTPACSHAAWVD